MPFTNVWAPQPGQPGGFNGSGRIKSSFSGGGAGLVHPRAQLDAKWRKISGWGMDLQNYFFFEDILYIR